MRTKLKAQKICLWITLVCMIPIQIFGWIVAVVDASDIGGYSASSGIVIGILLAIAILGMVASLAAVYRCGKYDIPPKGLMIGAMLASTLSPIVSSLYAFYLRIGFIVLLMMLGGCILGIVNLIFSLRTFQEAKRAKVQA